MAKRKSKLDVGSSGGLDFSKLFQSKMNEVINEKDLPEQKLIPTGISLFDTIIGGGILTGTYTSFAAPAGSGKSTFCLILEANFKRLYPDGYIIHIDSEQVTTDTRMRSLGVPLGKDDTIWKMSYDMSVEEVFKTLSNFIEIKEKFACEEDESYRGIPTLFVWDSVDASPTEKIMEVDSSEKATGQKPKQLNFFIQKNLRNFRKYNIAFVTVNHITPKLNMMGPYEQYDGNLSSLKQFTIAGGKPVVYYPSNLIFLRGRENTKKMEELIKEKYHLESAFVVEAKTLKCKTFSYNMTVDLIFDTIRGFDDFTTKLHNMSESNWFIPEGRSLYLRGTQEYKFKLDEVRDLYYNNLAFREKFEEDWNAYIDDRFGEFKKIMNKLMESYNNFDISGVTENIDIAALNSVVADIENKRKANIEEDDNTTTAMKEAVFELSENEMEE